MEAPLTARVEYLSPAGQKVPVHSFPVQFEFTLGKGILQEKAVSDPGGEVKSYLQKIESSLKKQKVTVKFDHTALLQEEDINSPLVGFFLPEGSIPAATFDIELQKSDAWFTAVEQIFGTPAISQPFANLLKSELNETFFNFTPSAESASYIVETDVNFRKGEIKEGTGYTVYLVFADLYFSIISAETGTEIFSDTVTGIKGMRPGSYQYALKEAREKLLKKFREEIYPQLESLNL